MKKPWRVGPNEGERQAYVIGDAEGRPIVRQSLTHDGRVMHFDMTPDEAATLILDLESARRDALYEPLDHTVPDYPESRF